MITGFYRPSTDQSVNAAAEAELTRAGCQRVIPVGRSKASKPITALQQSELVVIPNLLQLGASFKEVVTTLQACIDNRWKLRSLAEGMDLGEPMGVVMAQGFILGARTQSAFLSEKTRESLAKAAKQGKRHGRKHSLTNQDAMKAKEMLLDPGTTKSAVASHFQVSIPTLNASLARVADKEPDQQPLPF